VTVDEPLASKLTEELARDPDEVVRGRTRGDLSVDLRTIHGRTAVEVALLIEATTIFGGDLPGGDLLGELDQRNLSPVRVHVGLARLERRAEQDARVQAVDLQTEIAGFGLGAQENRTGLLVLDHEDVALSITEDHRLVPARHLASLSDGDLYSTDDEEATVRTSDPIRSHDPLGVRVRGVDDRSSGLREDAELVRLRTHGEIDRTTPQPSFNQLKSFNH